MSRDTRWHDVGRLHDRVFALLLALAARDIPNIAPQLSYFPSFYLFRLPPFSPLSPISSSHVSAMAIQKEPGQKGVNWSNIAVGKSTRTRHVQ